MPDVSHKPDQYRTRLIIAGVASVGVVALAAVVVLVIVVSGRQDPVPPPPEEIITVLPENNGQALRQDSVGVTTLPTWSCELRIDGVRIPEAQIEGTAELGECLYRPGADKIFETLEPGPHTARVTITNQVDTGDQRSYAWSFVTQ